MSCFLTQTGEKTGEKVEGLGDELSLYAKFVLKMLVATTGLEPVT